MFTTVITLVTQNRVKDEGWNCLLNRLRTGDCTINDLKQLAELVLTPNALDFSVEP